MNKLRILVVEDETLVGRNMVIVLRKADMDAVGPVGTAGAALALVETSDFDAALLDVNLRGLPSFPVASVL